MMILRIPGINLSINTGTWPIIHSGNSAKSIQKPKAKYDLIGKCEHMKYIKFNKYSLSFKTKI